MQSCTKRIKLKIVLLRGHFLKKFRRCPLFALLYRKFLKSSEIVYNGLEIKNDITKERRRLRHDVVYEVFCFGLHIQKMEGKIQGGEKRILENSK